MSQKSAFEKATAIAVENIIKHGDTDIFPFPFENYAISDEKEEFIKLLLEYENHFKDYLTKYPPSNESSLTPISYFGFRWATQIDPLWNAYLLSCVIAIAPDIEAARIAKEQDVVFSYRYSPDQASGDLFDRDYSWTRFMEKSVELSENAAYVVVCDISEFYPRLGHHRLENALKQATVNSNYPTKIISLLSNFSNTKSFGLPIGGPASRILSEITINQIDRLLSARGIKFCRFADDFHIFASSKEEAYKNVIFLSEKLLENQGLSLQKSKTRILTAAEFRATNPIKENEATPEVAGEAAAAAHTRASALMRFSLRFDPYSPTAESDYEKLKEEVKKFDIIGLLKKEIVKTRIHIALSRKLISAIRYLEGQAKEDAVISIIENHDILYPIYSSALVTIADLFTELENKTKDKIIEKIIELINTESHILRADVTLCYALRILKNEQSPRTLEILQRVYDNRASQIIRRDVIMIMAGRSEWYWLSDLRNKFRHLTPMERRAFIVCSYALKDEGSHWRDHTKREFSPFESFIMRWASNRATKNSLSFSV
jgi:hypothetical protein